MALTVPISLALGRFKQLPQRSHEVWQGGLIRMPTWIDNPADPGGAPYRPTGALWVSLRTGLVHLALPPDGVAPAPQFALTALLEFGLKHVKGLGGRPGRIEVRDPELRELLANALAGLSTTVAVVDTLPAAKDILAQFEAHACGGRVYPGLLDSNGMSVDRLRAFAEAASAFYSAAQWNHLANEDLIEVDGAGVPGAMRHVAVLGQGGQEFGVSFFASRAAFQRLLDFADGGRDVDRANGVTFGPMADLPFADVDAWLDHDLPVASSRAYPLAVDLRRDGGVRRPDAQELTYAEALLRALASTTEDEIDSGRWRKQIETFDGMMNLTLSLPSLLEAEGGHPSAPLPLSAMPRVAERSSARIARLLGQKSFDSIDDANAELQRARQTGLFDDVTNASAGVALTNLERAQELAYDAMEARGRLRIKRARQALALSPDCADAWGLLAEVAPTAEICLERYESAVAAGARAIGAARFDSLTGEFWGHLETRPYMRARLGMARTLEEIGRIDDAVTHYRELLRLNPGDNQGVRYMLLVALLQLDRDDEAAALLDEHEDDIQALWPYARTLLTFRHEGDTAASRDALAAATAANAHVIKFLLEPDFVPSIRATHFTLGSKEEAAYVAEALGHFFDEHQEMLDWLRAQHRRTRARRTKPRAKARRASK